MQARRRARSRERAGIPPRQRLASLVREHGAEDAGEEVADLIAQLEIDPRIEHQDYIVDLADERFPRAVAEGLLQRVREGRELPIRTTGRLVRAGFGLEDDALLDLALESERARDGRAEAAASVLGPRAVARLIDRVVELDGQIRDAGKEAEKAAKDLHSAVRDRICYAEPAHVLAAIEERAGEATNQRIEYFADLLVRDGGWSGTTGRRVRRVRASEDRRVREGMGGTATLLSQCDPQAARIGRGPGAAFPVRGRAARA